MTETDQLKIADERSFEYAGDILVIRHYNDQTWEILDSDLLPILSGKCGQTVEQDVADLSRKHTNRRDKS